MYHKNESLKLFNKRYGISGDMTYGANGLLYQLITTTKDKIKWILVDNINEGDYYHHLNKVIEKYGKAIVQNDKILSRTLDIGEQKKAVRNIDLFYSKIISSLFPKRFIVKNFGRGNHNYLEIGFGTYLLFAVLHYYEIDLKRIGIEMRVYSKQDLSGVNFFNKVMKFISDQTFCQLENDAKLLPSDEYDIWENSKQKLTYPEQITLLVGMLKTNIKYQIKIEKSSKSLINLLHIQKLIKKIIRFNITNKETKLQYYFDLFRLLHINLVKIIIFLKNFLPGINLAKIAGNIYPNKNEYQINKIDFGYGLYYLVENEYLNEHNLWSWHN